MRFSPRLLLVLLLSASCGSKSSDTQAPVATAAQKSRSLWSFAPPGWIAAIVIADGVGPKIDRAADEVRRIADAVGANHLVEMARKFVPTTLPSVELFDPSSFESIGIDIGQGFALFLLPDFSGVAVVGVSDRDAFVKAVGGQRTASSDTIGGAQCRPIDSRYLCASSEELWKQSAAARKGARSLGVTLAARAPEGTGDIISTFGGPVLGVRALRADFEIAGGRMTGRAEIEMDPPPGWLAARRRAPPVALTAADDEAFGFLRLRLPPTMYRNVPWPKRGPIDAGEILAPELTGDVAVISSGSHPLGVHVVAGLRDAGSVRVALRGACQLARFAGIGNLAWRNDRCEGNVNPRKLGAPRALLSWLPARVPIFLEIDSGAAVLSLFAPPNPGDATGNAAGAVATRLHAADWNLSGWGRWQDPLLALPDAQKNRLAAELSRVAAPATATLLRALIAHIYDAGFGVRATKDGLVVEASLTTFAADSPEAYRAYSDAVIRLVLGDEDAYHRLLASIAKRFRDSLAARQSNVRGLPLAPLVGFGALLDEIRPRPSLRR